MNRAMRVVPARSEARLQPCLEKCVRKALERHGITQEDEEDDGQEEDGGNGKRASPENDGR